MLFRCWSLKFKQSDHQFLHQSNVFHHINNILSKSDDGDSEESFSISIQSGFEAMSQVSHLTVSCVILLVFNDTLKEKLKIPHKQFGSFISYLMSILLSWKVSIRVL